MSTSRRTAFAHLVALAVRPNGWRITHLYAAGAHDGSSDALVACFRALRGEA
jgi:hypothetical protein